jgi:hypothetical protein
MAVGIGLLGGPMVGRVEAAPSSVRPATFDGPYELVSRSDAGVLGDEWSNFPALDGDGSVVAFTSSAANLVPGDTNGVGDHFVRDREAGTIERVSVSTAGEQGNGGPGPYVDEEPSLSGDGQIVAFTSRASNLVAGDGNGASDVFVRDRAAGTTTRVSAPLAGGQSNGMSYDPVLSQDGRWLAFTSYARLDPADVDGRSDVYLADRSTGGLRLLSSPTDAVDSSGPALSATGAWVAYRIGGRLVRHDLSTETVVDVVRGVGGAELDSSPIAGGISPDGRYVLFSSYATNVLPNDPVGSDAYLTDLATEVTTRLTDAVHLSGEVSSTDMSADGSAVLVDQMNRDLKIWWVGTSETTVVQREWQDRAVVSGDASAIAFSSGDATLVTGDGNGQWDVFVADLVPPADLAPPVVTCDPADGAWHDDDVAVDCTATDAGSGLADEADASFALSTSLPAGTEEADAATAARSVCDQAGNCTSASSSGHRVDRRAPTIAVDPASSGTFVQGAPVLAAYGCTDGGSGVASCQADLGGAPVASGAALPTDEVGSETLVVTGTDAVGNAQNGEAEVEVVAHALRGVVRTDGGIPLEGATVELWPVGSTDPVAWDLTDASGEYALDAADVAPGDHQVRATHPERTSAWSGGTDRASATVLALGVRPAVADVELAGPADEIAPEVTCTEPPAGILLPLDVVVGCSAVDEVGLADPADAAFTLSTSVADGTEDPAASTGTRTVCDAAENCTTVGPFGPYGVDRAAPVVEISNPTEGEVLPLGTIRFLEHECTDLTLVSCEESRIGPLDTEPGQHQVSVTATDGYGRTTTVVRTYRVLATTLRGYVVNEATQGPLSSVQVEIGEVPWSGEWTPTVTVETSPNGFWSAPGLSPDRGYWARFSKPGFRTTFLGGSTTAAESEYLYGPPDGVSQQFVHWMEDSDVSPPTVTCSDPGPTSFWRPDQVQVQCTATDPAGLSPATPPTFLLGTSVPAGAEVSNASTSSQQVCDRKGNCTTVGPFTGFKIDRKAPTISCPAPSTAWRRTEAFVQCGLADGGVGAFAPAVTLQTQVGVGNWSANASTIPVYVCDQLDNCAVVSTGGFRIDRSMPTATCTPVPTGWFAGNRSVNCTPSDTGSGYTGTATLTAFTNLQAGQESANAAATVPFCDVAGNCRVWQVPGFKIDRKGPTVSCGTADSTWRNQNRTFACTQSDGGSGIPPTYQVTNPFPFPPFFPLEYPNPVDFSISTNVAAGAESSNATASDRQRCDVVGNCTSVAVNGSRIDRKAPTATCPTPSSSWLGANVTVPCSVADGGSGTDTTSFLASTTVAVGEERAAAPLSTTTVCDRVANCAPLGGPVLGGPGTWKIDRKAPAASCPSAPPPGALADDEIAVACTATDGGSGLRSIFDGLRSLSTDVGPGAEGEASTGSWESCDAVGNCATVGPFGPYEIDRLAPRVTVSVPADGAKVPFGATVLADLGCDDRNLVSCTPSVADGEPLATSLGSHELEVVGVDAVGRTTTVVHTYEVVADDLAAPSVSCAAPVANAAWSGSDVVVTCTAADPVALADPAQSTFTLATAVPVGTTTTAATTASVDVCDAFGNCRTVGSFGPYRVDRTAPTSGCAAGPAGWTRSEVVVWCFPADAGAGLSSSTAFQLATAVGAGAWDDDASTASRTICDRVGNCTTARLDGLRIDRAGPTLTCSPAPTTWSKVNTSVPCVPSDAGAGYGGAPVVHATTSVASASESSSATGSASACDVVGNCSSVVVAGFKVDRRAPVVECDAPSGQWHGSNRPVACRQVDGGSGIAPTSPSGPHRNLTAWTAISLGTETANATATAGASCDLVGNCASIASHGHRIDRRAPRALCPASDGQWRADNVSFTCTPIDEGVGVDALPFTSSTNTPNRYELHSVPATKAYVCDRLNNCAQIGSQGLWRIDRLSPRVTTNGTKDGAIVRLGQAVTVGYSCKDGGSGLVSCDGSVPSDLVVTTSELGPGSVTIEAVDAAGNVTTTTVSWTVVPAVSGRVLDRTTGAPISGATVHRYADTGTGPALESVVTAADGTFAFATVDPGRYRYSAVLPGSYPERWYGSLNLAGAPPFITDATTPRSLGALLLAAST